MLVGLMQILLGRQNKEKSLGQFNFTNGQRRFKTMMNYFFKKHMQMRSSFIHPIA
jgi:hypothetical protein